MALPTRSFGQWFSIKKFTTLSLLLLLIFAGIGLHTSGQKKGNRQRSYHSKSYTPTRYKSYSPRKGYSHNSYRIRKFSAPSYTKRRSNYSYGVHRDSKGRIKRSAKARYEFMKMTGYPNGRKGYVIDHIIPLKKGGCDCPANMQWQTKEAAKQKDQWE